MEINNQAQNLNKELLPKGQEGQGFFASFENTNIPSEITPEDMAVLSVNQTLDFKEQLNFLSKNDIFDFSDIDFAETYDFETAEMDEDDAKFFLDVIEYNKTVDFNPNAGMVQEITNNIVQEPVVCTKNVKATEKIMQILETTVRENKPVRIDFDNEITVVLRVDEKGKLFANFYPGDNAAEEYLRQNIQSLRNTFDRENILYSYLGYSKNRGNNKKERQGQR